MLVSEVIKSYPALTDVNTNLITKVCLERNLTPGDSYAASMRQSTELAVADLYVEVAASPDFREGDLSIKQASEKLLARANAIYQKYDDPAGNQVTKPSIRNGSQFW